MSPSVQPIVRQELHERIVRLQTHFEKDAVAIVSPIEYGLDDAFRDAVESIDGEKRREGLLIVLHTTGD